MQESHRLKQEVALLQDMLARAAKKALSLKKYFKALESNQEKLEKEKKDMIKKIQELEEDHEQEKKDLFERHAKRAEEYESQLSGLKKALKQLVKQKKKDTSCLVGIEVGTEITADFTESGSIDSMHDDYRLSVVKMHYENKIQGLEAKHKDE
eukprot:43045-Ditylum_brightwellii.AAC.1